MAKKVLVVDDEKLIVKGIRFSLEQDGMEVDCAYDFQLEMGRVNDMLTAATSHQDSVKALTANVEYGLGSMLSRRFKTNEGLTNPNL